MIPGIPTSLINPKSTPAVSSVRQQRVERSQAIARVDKVQADAFHRNKPGQEQQDLRDNARFCFEKMKVHAHKDQGANSTLAIDEYRKIDAIYRSASGVIGADIEKIRVYAASLLRQVYGIDAAKLQPLKAKHVDIRQ